MINLYGDISTEIDWLTSRDEKFRYMMLDRLRCDCEYFLGYGQGRLSIVGGNIFYHIRTMKALWISLPEKPQWLSYFEILQYQDKMMAMSKDKLAKRHKKAQSALDEALKKLKSMPKTEIINILCDALDASDIDYYVSNGNIILK